MTTHYIKFIQNLEYLIILIKNYFFFYIIYYYFLKYNYISFENTHSQLIVKKILRIMSLLLLQLLHLGLGLNIKWILYPKIIFCQDFYRQSSANLTLSFKTMLTSVIFMLNHMSSVSGSISSTHPSC